ncbi:polyisoprenoid-binding protein [Neptunitalea chrysea]|uniref:Polyisoprenoid-binding protein n=1 Tax=Neptunitalea chrysea TaxID=1647581 RepID=A0A9W6B3G5_9FLAO|nr:YceI family protein [Neptunitalea chrysea]GLB51746.1 polyisoprenoid-binding protein [Neptunitalea chrysea]
MKKFILTFIIAASLMVSCNTAPKEKSTEKKLDMSMVPAAKIDSLKLEWTGYKTTAKTPVSGVFKEVSVSGENKKAASPEEVLNGATFTASVASLFSGNEIRDPKLIDIFFGTMVNTPELKGVLHLEEKPFLSITMNDVTKEVPVTTSFKDGVYRVEGDVKLADFNAIPAVEAIAKACYELHTGIDGVSKTWDEAHFKGSVYFAQK